MKKIIIVLSFLLSLTLVSCKKTKLSFEEFTSLVNDFTIEEAGGEVTDDFSLPLFIKRDDNTINIKWEIIKGDSGAEIINDNQVRVYRPESNDDNVDVMIEATFSYEKYQAKKQFSFKVLKYEEENIVLKDAYVLYINIDGFARYYYDKAIENNLVENLESFKKDGVFFDNLRNEYPSLTNPMQNMIVSGATSSKTQNVYRYYDKINDIVIQQARENKADNLYHAAVRSNVTMASVRHFTGEDVLSTTNLNRLYVNTPQGLEANLENRFMQAIKLVKGEEFQNGTDIQKVREVPRLLTLYVDELDAFGHNEAEHYGQPVAKNETQRINNVLEAIAKIDLYVKELVDAYKDRGLYNKLAVFITTDHGMAPFGHDTNNITEALNSIYAKSKWPNLRDKLKSINPEYIFEYVKAGGTPKNNTSVVGVSGGLQMSLTFKNHRLTNDDLDQIKREIEKEEYVYEVLTRNDLRDLGIWRGANIDLIVVPKERYHFHGVDSPNNLYRVRGQHDSTVDAASHIYGIIFGGIITPGILETKKISVLSFGSTMAEVLGLNLRDKNVDALEIIRNG